MSIQLLYSDVPSLVYIKGEQACSYTTKLAKSNLNSGFCELRPLGQLLSGVDVWIMCPLKGLLQLLQLLSGEGGAAASLLPLQRQVGLRIHVGAVVGAVT